MLFRDALLFVIVIFFLLNFDQLLSTGIRRDISMAEKAKLQRSTNKSARKSLIDVPKLEDALWAGISGFFCFIVSCFVVDVVGCCCCLAPLLIFVIARLPILNSSFLLSLFFSPLSRRLEQLCRMHADTHRGRLR